MSDDKEQPPQDVFIPTYPLDSPGADVILRSSDGADFPVHRAILALVSPFFRDMFALPQPEAEPTLPVVQVAEGSAALDQALRFFYPGAQPAVATLDELRAILDVLVSKCDMQCLAPMAIQHLRTYLVDQPIAVYTIAFAHQWKDLAIAAAKESLKLRLRVVDEVAPAALNHIPAAAYHNLLHYHYLCGAAAKRVTAVLRWVPGPAEYVWFTCNNCTPHPLSWYLADGTAHRVRLWFIDCLKSLGDPVGEAPGIDIRHHESIYAALKIASQCNVCRPKIFQQLPDWIAAHLRSQITQAIEQVELSF
ncbi:hypothetical protein FB451DRAFT_1097839 [Mycena latifolia]|nr:hypothetical protein FB451DRAFT_1097839 [Mycena latifolia]